MFDKLSQLKRLKELQDSLKDERVEVEKQGIKVIFNGKMEIEEIQLNSEFSKQEQEKILKDCFNEAIKKVQMAVAQKMSQMPDFNF
ncbi:YbaB/EbfC family nucleoid-associated protein [Candidatus Parcubacteria bacterium]|nr:YbaB/EbfC family nucleoid-associated protein [Candidatus Parcubacteria bacterium]